MAGPPGTGETPCPPPDRPGERHLQAALRARARERHAPRPEPSDAWGWAIEDRLKRVEDLQKWLLLLMAGAVVGSLLNLVLQYLK